MLSNSKLSKISRKQRRCSAIVSKEIEIETSDCPTEFLGICNAGLSTGLQEEILIQEALKFNSKITEILMIPNKSYCFLKTSNIQDAISIYNGMHGLSKIGQNNAIVCLAYFKNIPKIEKSHTSLNDDDDIPSGLIILENFINDEEEEILLKAVFNNFDNKNQNDDTNSLKHRFVKHFGYEFLYGSNQVDPDKPLNRNIPKECDLIWEKMKKFKINLEWYNDPDQLTVNHYKPGQGIPSHVDTHSAFLDPIFVVSLEGDILMEFKNEQKKISILIPQRSMLIISDESRYDWTHGITPRFMDIISSKTGGLTIKHRQNRTSLTFRKLRRGPCNCKFSRLCDSRQQKDNDENNLKNDNDDDRDVITQDKLKNCAKKLENENVHKVYDEIANHFSKTRHTPWPKVTEFLNSFEFGSIILDIGCGNGKYLGRQEDDNHQSVIKIGCDRSEKLLQLCCEKNYNVFRCDCLSVPFRDNCIDGCISIAVIHHLATQERRLQAIKEMSRILRKNGRGLIYVWAKNQELNSKKSNYLRQDDKEENTNNKINFKIHENHKIESIKSENQIIQLPVHVNRTKFIEQDVFVPWKLQDRFKAATSTNDEKTSGTSSTSNKETFLRYYHVFEENELENLCKMIENVEIEKSYYDEGNWCVIFRKI